MRRYLCSYVLAGILGLAGPGFMATARAAELTEEAQAALKDVGKKVVERSTERLVGEKSGPASAKETMANPKVEPGKVKWHKTIVDACEAAKKSGKPVLLFQMMGNLDEQFC